MATAVGDVSFIAYEIPMRPGGVRVRLVLPEDLTPAEAERLVEVIRAIALDQ